MQATDAVEVCTVVLEDVAMGVVVLSVFRTMLVGTTDPFVNAGCRGAG